MSDTTAKPVLSVGPQSYISLPMVTLIGLLTLSALWYAAWSDQRGQVARNATDIVEIKKEQQQNREILIRIDENVKQLKKDNP